MKPKIKHTTKSRNKVPSVFILHNYPHPTLYLPGTMSPEFKASVRAYTEALLENKFGTNGTAMTRREHDMISGLVYRFIQRLTVQAIEVANVKGKYDAECYTFACRKNLPMFKRLSCLLRAEADVQIEKFSDVM